MASKITSLRLVVLIAGLAVSLPSAIAQASVNCHLPEPAQPITCHCPPVNEPSRCFDTTHPGTLSQCTNQINVSCLLNVSPVGIFGKDTACSLKKDANTDDNPITGVRNIGIANTALFAQSALSPIYYLPTGSKIYLITLRLRN